MHIEKERFDEIKRGIEEVHARISLIALDGRVSFDQVCRMERILKAVVLSLETIENSDDPAKNELSE